MSEFQTPKITRSREQRYKIFASTPRSQSFCAKAWGQRVTRCCFIGDSVSGAGIAINHRTVARGSNPGSPNSESRLIFHRPKCRQRLLGPFKLHYLRTVREFSTGVFLYPGIPALSLAKDEAPARLGSELTPASSTV